MAEGLVKICCKCGRWSFPPANTGCPGSRKVDYQCKHRGCKRCGRGILKLGEKRVLKPPRQ